MKKGILILFVLFLNWIASVAGASTFKGYQKSSGSSSNTLTETVLRIEETPKAFLLQFSQHAAFYRFPKIKGNESDARDFLKSRNASKKILVIEIDPISAKVLNIRDQ